MFVPMYWGASVAPQQGVGLDSFAVESAKRKRVDDKSNDPDEVSGFVRTVYTLLKVADPTIVSWDEEGTHIIILEPTRFASEICPKFFRHRNFQSFTRLLNMYQFHKVPGAQRDAKHVVYSHQHFQRGHEELLHLIQRKQSSSNNTARTNGSAETNGMVAVAAASASELLLNNMLLTKALDANAKTAAPVNGAGAAANAIAALNVDAMPSANNLMEIEAHLNSAQDSPTMLAWKRRAAELERENARLRDDCARMKLMEAERDALQTQVKTLQELIQPIQEMRMHGMKMGMITPAVDTRQVRYRSIKEEDAIDEAREEQERILRALVEGMRSAPDEGSDLSSADEDAAMLHELSCETEDEGMHRYHGSNSDDDPASPGPSAGKESEWEDFSFPTTP